MARSRLPRALSRLVLIAVLAIGVIFVVVAVRAEGTREGSDMQLVGYAPYRMGTDFQFQRRSGNHNLDGVSVSTTTDLVFAGAHQDSSRSDGGIEIIDITDPSDPASLTRIPCPGYQSDVAVHERLLLQTLDHAASNAGWDAEWLESSGSAAVDQPGSSGVRIFDVTDPARPKLVHFLEVEDEVGGGVHNVTVLPWVGIAYLSELDGELGILDLTDSAFPYTAIEVTSISAEIKTSCHDIGLDPVRLLAFCAANEDETYILDVRDPARPVYAAKIVNGALSRHHEARMAPDGTTLVLQSEYDHPPALDSDAPAGLWFYDLTDPTDPVVLGSWAPDSCEPSERDERACTSHSFNFVPATKLVVPRGGTRACSLLITPIRLLRRKPGRTDQPAGESRSWARPRTSGRPTPGTGTCMPVPVILVRGFTSSAMRISLTPTPRPMTKGRAGDDGPPRVHNLTAEGRLWTRRSSV